MRTFRRPMTLEMTGFDSRGIVVGSAWMCFFDSKGGWEVSIDKESVRVGNEHEAAEKLTEAGAVTIKRGDGRKY